MELFLAATQLSCAFAGTAAMAAANRAGLAARDTKRGVKVILNRKKRIMKDEFLTVCGG